MQVLMGILFILMFSFLLLYMVYLRIHGMVSIGDFSFVFGIALVIADDIWHVTLSMQDFSRNMGDLMSALTIVSIPHQNLDKENAIPLVIKSPTVEFRGLSFSYSEKESFFQDLNLTIKAGEKIGLVGASGAGKSSLVNVLLRYFPYKEGDIFIGGENIKDVTQDSLREQIAVIPQDTLLFHRTLMENIRYGKPEATDKEVIKASKKAHLHEDIITLPHQYNTEVGERGVKLSGGQRQRVAIARAILKDAPILVLDEATSALDSHTEQLIQESLDFLMNDKKKTVIAIAHRLSTLKHADRIIVLEKGKIVEEGDHVTLIADPKSVYKRLWELQQI
jgi:ATP-binding cassette subfamily B protein